MRRDPVDMYRDIIRLPRPRSARHAPMPRAERAAQFSAFAALSGHGEAIQETARLTDSQMELADNACEAMDEVLALLRRTPGRQVRVTWFEADARKSGGAYRTSVARFERVDEARRCLVLGGGLTIPLEAIFELSEA